MGYLNGLYELSRRHRRLVRESKVDESAFSEGQKTPNESRKPVESERIKEARDKSSKDFIQVLVELRNDGLPAYPSAQLWHNMTADEKDELKKKVVECRKVWSDYQRDMFACHPKRRRH